MLTINTTLNHLVILAGDIDCPYDIEQNAIHGEEGAVVFWPNITEDANFTCFNQDENMVVESGDEFPIGGTIVHCMNGMNDTCEFGIYITGKCCCYC